jgi:hypothetical protein
MYHCPIYGKKISPPPKFLFLPRKFREMFPETFFTFIFSCIYPEKTSRDFFLPYFVGEEKHRGWGVGREIIFLKMRYEK